MKFRYKILIFIICLTTGFLIDKHQHPAKDFTESPDPEPDPLREPITYDYHNHRFIYIEDSPKIPTKTFIPDTSDLYLLQQSLQTLEPE